MAHIFITGGTGFVGTQIIKQLAANGHQISALMRSTQRLSALHDQLDKEAFRLVTAIVGDLTQPGLGISKADHQTIRQADIIIHAGGSMDIMLGELEAKQVFLDAADFLSQLASDAYINGKLRHFIHVVGFKSPVTDQNMDNPAAIQKLLEHESPYERMKIRADLHIREQAKLNGYPLSVVNPSVVIGDSATGNTEQTGGLGILVAAARRKLMGTVPGGGSCWLPLVHVDHAAAFITALVDEPQPVNETYYLLDEQGSSPNMTELIQGMNKELRLRAPIGSISLPLLKRLLGGPLGSKLGIPQQSLSFIVNADFPTEATKRMQLAHKLHASINADILPYIVADLDYRLSHNESIHPGFSRGKRGPLATLEKKGSGNPILLLPGTFSGADCFMPLALELHERHIWIADLPGFGRSPYHHHSEGVIEGHVQSIITAITEHSQPITLVGHSYGALLAAKVMEAIPERIQSMHLLQPALHPTYARYRLPGINRFMLSKLSRHALNHSLINQGCFESHEQIPVGYTNYILDELKSPRVRATLADTLSALTKSDTFKLQPANWNTVPIHITWGILDRYYKLPQAYSRLPVIQLERGHHFPISHPAETAALLRQAGL
ncbi:nucleoside-diphosphate-sugar epimerase/pimeloyl-ACP methyl ester carboxylesterase [Paenibacillus endophyticus]|uniref:Nucleoside-diphosphate-sugar epimerase/pimeloyl-ACP methyl ester carboxylesterase n=1 Tax=Paenibacillus endophyticus TaxID=1294268 RepID=A0A7W5C907_9BACL|nr:alpha/beta fold hydrolase [Paenibacillus endophyticus]MBB3153217.1 nucleoside-diphosphate-sugar epimerase/pimeloyl-ACP methyl ester carboxylesterase [Paenibacillus endophyticus]